MIDVRTFPFKKEKFHQLLQYHLGVNWPVVYIQENGKEMYIGQTTDVYSRSNQHYEKEERRRLERIHVLTDIDFNLSAAFDFESFLIQYVAADGVFKLQNGNGGLINHNYYNKDEYRAKFQLAWAKLQEMGLVKQELISIQNTEFFKYSPYKALTPDQLIISAELEQSIRKAEPVTHIVNGVPGTGKTILAMHLLKNLKGREETKDLSVALVIPMTSLRSTLKRVVQRVPKLSADMVIGPADVVKKRYDLLIVDEAHRLRRRVNVTNFKSYDDVNKKLNLGKEATQLDWILNSSKQQILFYDQRQSVMPGDVPAADFKKLNAIHHELVSQMRVEGGDDYLRFVDDLLALKPIEKMPTNYDFRVYDDISKMVADIKEKDKEYSLARLVAGYAWPWKTAKGKGEYDIEIDGVKLVWNSTNIDWVNSKNSINEVGCIHTIQGYDLNYAGVIIGPELSYDEVTGKLVVDKNKYEDSNGKRSVQNSGELQQYVINIYKTLLTRGIKGTYIYIVDPKLRDRIVEDENIKSWDSE